MIVRVLTAQVRNERAGSLHELMRRELEELHGQPGLVYAKLARRIGEVTEEVVLFEEWATAADLYIWTGGDLTRPRLFPGTEELIDNLVITHYEALDRTPDDFTPAGRETDDGVAIEERMPSRVPSSR